MDHNFRETPEACDIKTFVRGGVREHVISARSFGSDPLAAFRQFPPTGMEVLIQHVFGGRTYLQDAMGLMGRVNWPMTWVHGDGCSGDHVGGMQAFAVSGARVRRIELDGQLVGHAYDDADAEYCYLGGVGPADLNASRPRQAESCFDRILQALAQAGMDFSHVARTWIYLDRLLEWYGPFNEVRTRFFKQHNVFQHLVPASTGIGGGNPQGSAMACALLAIKPRHDGVRIFAVPSPLQCPALDYHSSFSRAVEIQRPGLRQLLISGTASIDPDGHTAHVNDSAAQIELTMKVIAAILESRRMNWSNTTRMVAYFKSMRDLPLFTDWCCRNRLFNLPVVYSHADVCRDDLLFEVEMDAAANQ